MPVPRVSVRNCDLKPINPRAGMRNSSRTRPDPWLTILVIAARRVPSWAITIPLVLLGHVHHEILDRFQRLAAGGPRDDLRPRRLQLVPFPPHHLDQDRELQLAAPHHLLLVRRLGLFDANRHVADQLAREPFAQVARGDVLALPPGHRRGVDAEDYRHGRFVHVDRRDWPRAFGVGDRLSDGDALDAGQADDVARRRPIDLDAPQPVEGEQLGDARLLLRAIELADGDLVAERDLAVEDAADGEAPEVVARVQVGYQGLERRAGIAAGRGT